MNVQIEESDYLICYKNPVVIEQEKFQKIITQEINSGIKYINQKLPKYKVKASEKQKVLQIEINCLNKIFCLILNNPLNYNHEKFTIRRIEQNFKDKIEDDRIHSIYIPPNFEQKISSQPQNLTFPDFCLFMVTCRQEKNNLPSQETLSYLSELILNDDELEVQDKDILDKITAASRMKSMEESLSLLESSEEYKNSQTNEEKGKFLRYPSIQSWIKAEKFHQIVDRIRSNRFLVEPSLIIHFFKKLGIPQDILVAKPIVLSPKQDSKFRSQQNNVLSMMKSMGSLKREIKKDKISQSQYINSYISSQTSLLREKINQFGLTQPSLSFKTDKNASMMVKSDQGAALSRKISNNSVNFKARPSSSRSMNVSQFSQTKERLLTEEATPIPKSIQNSKPVTSNTNFNAKNPATTTSSNTNTTNNNNNNINKNNSNNNNENNKKTNDNNKTNNINSNNNNDNNKNTNYANITNDNKNKINDSIDNLNTNTTNNSNSSYNSNSTNNTASANSVNIMTTNKPNNSSSSNNNNINSPQKVFLKTRANLREEEIKKENEYNLIKSNIKHKEVPNFSAIHSNINKRIHSSIDKSRSPTQVLEFNLSQSNLPAGKKIENKSVVMAKTENLKSPEKLIKKEKSKSISNPIMKVSCQSLDKLLLQDKEVEISFAMNSQNMFEQGAVRQRQETAQFLLSDYFDCQMKPINL